MSGVLGRGSVALHDNLSARPVARSNPKPESWPDKRSFLRILRSRAVEEDSAQPLPEPPLVSVVVPANNREATVRGSIESVLRQTFRDFELIFVDDGSTDDTLAEVHKIKDHRIRILRHSRNYGASAARNTGIAAARGKWVAFQDSDDEWLPLKLEKQIEELERPGASFLGAFCGMIIIGSVEQPAQDSADHRQLRYIPHLNFQDGHHDLFQSLLNTNFVSTQTLVVRRDILEQIDGFDEEMPSLVDWECLLRIVPFGQLAFIDEPLVLQRFSSNSLTRDLCRRLQARTRIVEKHRNLLVSYPKIMARHFYSIAGLHRRLGNLRGARAALAEARAADPLNPRIWTISICVTAMNLFPRARRGQLVPFAELGMTASFCAVVLA